MKTAALDGRWEMQIAGETVWHEARVPGSVYADLLNDGTISDPFYRDNELAAFDLMKHDFLYRRSFTVDHELLESKHILLRCDGLDTLAKVSLNGTELGFADNMHTVWEWDVKALLKAGENTIEIMFLSPVRYVLDRYGKDPIFGATESTPGFPYLRKAHCMFGWDWGPRLPDAGIWRGIGLVCIDEARLNGVLITQHHDEHGVRLQIDPEIGMSTAGDCEYSVTAPDGTETDGGVHGGADGCTVAVSDPRLWWPSGYGDQPLYTVTVKLFHQGILQDTWTRRIGLRTLTVAREKDEWGESFCHVVNGVKIFAMGADYIPEDNILSRVTPAATRRLLEDAKLANFNCIRVWGGGYYPDDFFFDICDELGLMVWQDFMFACANYALDEAFERSVRREAEQNIRRIRHHACLALLCGNNENEMFLSSAIKAAAHGREDHVKPYSPQNAADYIKLNEYILPELCHTLAPQVFYWPSSPSSGGAFDEPTAENRGDVHYWDVWHGEKPFIDYRNHNFRYVSEFGFQSFPCLETVKAFTLPQDRNIFSRIMEKHQRNNAANGKILNYLSQTYQYPETFEHLLYCSQLLQAHAIRCGVEHWRRHRGQCMGTIYWQLNDCWPVASWASVDYHGRWKALQYAAKRFFAPVLLSAHEEGEHTADPNVNAFHMEKAACGIRLNVANETRGKVGGKVTWALRDRFGAVLRQGEEALTVDGLASQWLETIAFPNADAVQHYASFAFVSGGETLSEGTALFCAPKHFRFADPGLTVTAGGSEIIVTSKGFAKDVCIQSGDANLVLSDNYFDMNPGQKRVKILRGSAERIRVFSLYDTLAHYET